MYKMQHRREQTILFFILFVVPTDFCVSYTRKVTHTAYMQCVRSRHISEQWANQARRRRQARLRVTSLRGGSNYMQFNRDSPMIEVTDSLLSQLLEALRVMHDPCQPHENRQDALSFCLYLQGCDEACKAAAIRLVDTRFPDEARHYGYQLFVSLVRERWDRLGEEYKAILKSTTINLLQNGTKPLLLEKRFVKEKAVQVLVSLARRDWPVRWPDMMQVVIDLAFIGDTQCELALMFLRAVSEDIMAEEVPVVRRNQMLQALHKDMPHILDFLARLAIGALQRPAASPERRALLDAAGAAMEVYANVAPVRLVCSSGLVPPLLAMLHEPEHRARAVEALLCFVSKKTRDAPPAAMLDLLQRLLRSCADMAATTLSTVGQRRLAAAGGPEEYEFHKRMAAAMVEFGINHVHGLAALVRRKVEEGGEDVEGWQRRAASIDEYLGLMGWLARCLCVCVCLYLCLCLCVCESE